MTKNIKDNKYNTIRLLAISHINDGSFIFSDLLHSPECYKYFCHAIWQLYNTNCALKMQKAKKLK